MRAEHAGRHEAHWRESCFFFTCHFLFAKKSPPSTTSPTKQPHHTRRTPLTSPSTTPVLWLLGTHPNHERKGAAAQIIRWAFPHADAAGLRCYVDASRLGHPLYRKCGFEDVGEMRLDLDRYVKNEGGEGMGVQRWVAMVREPRECGE